ncbi:hypothetical protein Tco_1006509 [Tanacetum coccineum]|uniref:Uncharacterized protein n=1 Tax=Tanacetum coccineum TaxID=301880 RepID=A0ABQ5FHW4_9ASTR
MKNWYEDQAGPSLRQSHEALAGPNPESMHDDFIAKVYPKVHESLKHTTEEHVHLENPLSSSGTLSSMKNLDDAFTFDDQFLNDKPTEEEPGKTTDKTTQALSSRIFTLELKDLPYKINQTVNEAVKEAVHKSVPHSKQPVEDVPIPDDMNISDSEDTDTAYLPKIKIRPDWLKPILEEDRPATPELDWIIPPNDLPEIENNWANALSSSYQDPDEYKLLWQTGDMSSFINWFCKRIRKKKLSKADLEGPAFKDLEYLVTRDKGRRSALSISKLKAAQYLDFGLEEIVPSLWIESERDYDISAAYGISHWWFKCKEFYITRHGAPSDRSTVRSHMRILSVVSLKTYERYGYTFLKEIVLRRADYNEYKISEADFKNLNLNDFKDLYLLHLQAFDLSVKEDYTIVSKPRVVIYRDRNDQKKMMRETEVHKFSDGTLNRILDKLDHMVKDFKYNLGMEPTQFYQWTIEGGVGVLEVDREKTQD